MLNKKNLIILDRDGTINVDNDNYIKNSEEWIPISGALEAITRLNKQGFHIIVVTNQSGINRRLFNNDTLNSMHEKMNKMLNRLGGNLLDIVHCPHRPDEKCCCRKPNFGMYSTLQKKYVVDFDGVATVGDTLNDLIAGVSVGCVPHLVLTGKGKKTLKNQYNEIKRMGVTVHDDLNMFSNWIISGREW